MKVPEWRRIDKGDLQAAIPKWFEVFLESYNKQMEVVSMGLGKLTFRDNFLKDILRVSLKHGAWTGFKLKDLQRQKTPATGALILSSGVAVTGFAWSRIDQETIQMRCLFEGSPADPVEVEVIFFG